VILLDTCTLLWLAFDQTELSADAISLLRDHAGLLFVSAITGFELGIKEKKRRLTLPLPAERYFATALAAHGLREVPLDGVVAVRSTTLPDLHADPADRIIVATAQARGFTVLTPDPSIHAYPNTLVRW
jgi:PIN domain nuclease of toxin-antitoxin system